MSFTNDSDSVFLLQLPSYVADRWREAREQSLGTLTIQTDQTPSVRLRLHGEYANDLPKDYTALVSSSQSKLFEVTNDEICVSAPLLQLKSQVERKLNPETGKYELDANVARLAKEKNDQERRKAKMMMTQEISLSDGHDKKHRLLSVAPTKRKDVDQDKSRKLKRARWEKSQLETMLFSLFEDKKQWTLGALQKRTDQPITWLKEVLNGIAVMNRSGANAGSYELKPEFVQDHD